MIDRDIQLSIENYDGPLDLLLELIKEKKMDIFDIDLAELATEYLAIIDNLKNTNIDLAGEYLVMAATLIQIKARMLLEIPNDKEVEEEKSDILSRLVEYQQFKQIAQQLKEKEVLRRNIFIKGPEDYEDYQLPDDPTLLDGHVDPVKLIIQLRKMFERRNAMALRETTIEKFNLSPAQRRIEILDLIKTNPNFGFDEIFSVPTINHFVVTMLTVLDMSRKQELVLTQKEQYGDIIIKKGVIND